MSTNSGITIGDISGIPSNIANHYYGRLSSYSLDATGAQYTWGTGDSDGLKAIFSLDFGSNTWYTYCTQDSGNTWAVPEAFPLGYRAKLYWGDNLFVGGDSTGKVATSTDASTWTVTTTLESSVVYMYYG